ncbi:MAG: cyclic nucleotide-binding domain-containing protein [Deltaproteobacteria bacterium]|nr:cyclic nucleotide-binding domain-containing protein [Deltaproteobacteria bacterium]
MWSEKDITREYKKGDIIIKEGDLGREMFIIKSGSVDVIKSDDKKEAVLATLERGDFFGEMAILENVPRTAMVIARETTHLIALNIGSLLIKIKKDPSFAFNMMQKMSHRIRVLNEKLLKKETRDKSDRSELNLAVTKSEYLRNGDL